MCWKMLEKLRRDLSWKRKVFLRKTQGTRAKTPCLMGRGSGSAGGKEAGQVGSQGKPTAV